MQQLRRKIKSRRFWYRKNFLRGNKVNRLKKKLSYNYSSKLQTLGPGSCAINITSQINEAECSGLSYIDLQAMLIGSNEWTKYYDSYKIYKIEQIAVTIYPNDAMNNAPTYINLDWFNTVKSEDGIKKMDSTKIIYNDMKKQKSYFFRPPNMVIMGGNPRKFNLRNYLPNAQLYFYQENGSLRGRVDARIIFKVPTEYTTSKDIKLKKVEKLIKLDENDMLESNLKTINNLRLTGVHENSFSYLPKEEEIPEEEKLEEDDENNKTIITKKNDLSWSLFDQIYKEDEEAKNKKKEKNKKKRKNKKEKRKKMIEKIKNNKLYRKLFKKQLDNFNKELKSTVLAELEYDRKRKQAKQKAIYKRKELGFERKLKKEQQFKEEPNKVIARRKKIKDIKQWLMERYKRISDLLELKDVQHMYPNPEDSTEPQLIKEKQNIQEIMQHIKGGKLNKKDLKYLGENLDNKLYDLDSIFNH